MLLLQATTVSDTLIVRQVPVARTGFEEVVFVSSGITSILVLVLVVVLLVVLVRLRAKVDETADRVDALLVDARGVAASAREMLAESRDTVHAANTRVRETVDTLADRVDDLSDILGRIHASAETVASVASTAIGGIKLGARAIGLGKKSKKPKRRVSRAEARRQRLAEEADGDEERPRLRRRD